MSTEREELVAAALLLADELDEIDARSKANAREQGWGIPEYDSPWTAAAKTIRLLAARKQEPVSDAEVEAAAAALVGWYSRKPLTEWPTDIQAGLREQARAALVAARAVTNGDKQ